MNTETEENTETEDDLARKQLDVLVYLLLIKDFHDTEENIEALTARIQFAINRFFDELNAYERHDA